MSAEKSVCENQPSNVFTYKKLLAQNTELKKKLIFTMEGSEKN